MEILAVLEVNVNALQNQDHSKITEIVKTSTIIARKLRTVDDFKITVLTILIMQYIYIYIYKYIYIYIIYINI